MKKVLKKITASLLATACLLSVITACESTDCPINNVVYSIYGFYAMSEDGPVEISVLDTLTITAAGTDSVLINRLQNGSSVELPVSYSAPTDTLVLHFTDTLRHTRRDTIWIDKQNIPHYESPDCPTSMFHVVTGVRWTSLLIDSVTITNPNINYNVSENFRIYFHTAGR